MDIYCTNLSLSKLQTLFENHNELSALYFNTEINYNLVLQSFNQKLKIKRIVKYPIFILEDCYKTPAFVRLKWENFTTFNGWKVFNLTGVLFLVEWKNEKVADQSFSDCVIN